MGLEERVWAEQYRELKKQSLAAYQAWDLTKCIKIKYVGAEVTATAEVKANSLELCAPALTLLYNLDITAAAYDTLAELVAYINALADWECTLGDQFDGTEASSALTIAGPTSVKNVEVWFARDTNLQIVITIPAVPAGSELVFAGASGKSTYGSGTSTIQVYDGATLVWAEAGGATTVTKDSLLKKLNITAGNALKLKILNSAAMTAGEAALCYEVKSPAIFTT